MRVGYNRLQSIPVWKWTSFNVFVSTLAKLEIRPIWIDYRLNYTITMRLSDNSVDETKLSSML
jgi:hypothetical protein